MGIGKKQRSFYAIFPEIDEQQYDTYAGIGAVNGGTYPIFRQNHTNKNN